MNKSCGFKNVIALKQKSTNSIKNKFKKLFFVFLLSFVSAFSVFAISVDLKTVDTVVTCNPNTGLAQVTVTLEWFAEDEMHGFDFMGEEAPLKFIEDKCWLDVAKGGTNGGKRLPLTDRKSTRLNSSHL